MRASLDITVAEAIDDLCTQILEADRRARPVERVRVSPRTYDMVADARRAELIRGNALLVLGYEVISDDSVQTGQPRIE